MVVPLAIFIGLAFVFEKFREKKDAIYCFLGGISIVFVLLFGILWHYQIVQDAYWFYILRNLAYSSGETWLQSFWRYFSTLNLSGSNEIAFINVVLIAYSFYLSLLQKEKKSHLKAWIYLSLLMLSTLYCIFKSGRNSDHYFILCLFPLFFVFNFAFNYSIWTKKHQIIYLSIIIFLFISRVTPAVFLSKIGNYNYTKAGNYLKEKAIADFIIRDALKNHETLDSIRLKVWGWGGSLHVLSGIPQATPNNSVDYETISSPSMKELSKELVMQHLVQKQPTYFVVKLGETFGYNIYQFAPRRCFPALDNYIKEHYTVIFNDSNGIEIWKKRFNTKEAFNHKPLKNLNSIE